MKVIKLTLALIAFLGCTQENIQPQSVATTSSSNEPEVWIREFHEAVDNGYLRIAQGILEQCNKKQLQTILNEPFWSRAWSKDSAGGGRKVYPLHVASDRGDHRLVSLLLDKGANPDVRTTTSRFTPLHLAVRSNRFEVVKLLLTKEAKNVTCIDDNAKTEGAHTITRDVLADVNAQDVKGYTPLHWAAKEGYKKIAALLLSNEQTRRSIIDNAGKTAGQLAQACNKPHIVKLFEGSAATPEWRRLYLDGAKECDEHCPTCPKCFKLDCGCFKAPCSFVCKTLCCTWKFCPCCPLKEETAHPTPSSSSVTTAPNPMQQPLLGNATMQR